MACIKDGGQLIVPDYLYFNGLLRCDPVIFILVCEAKNPIANEPKLKTVGRRSSSGSSGDANRTRKFGHAIQILRFTINIYFFRKTFLLIYKKIFA